MKTFIAMKLLRFIITIASILTAQTASAEAPPIQVPPAPASSGTAQDVETFVNLCNAGKFHEAKTSIRGYVDQRFLVKEILPFKIIPNSELNEAIASALPKAAEHAQSKQAKENALLAWDELQRCAKELKLDLKLATFNIQRPSDPVSGVLVFVTSSKGVVFAGSLDKIGRKLARDPKDGAKDEAKALLTTLKMCLYEVEQTSTTASADGTPSGDEKDVARQAAAVETPDAISVMMAKCDERIAAWDVEIAKEKKEKDPSQVAHLGDKKAFCAWDAAKALVKAGAYQEAVRYLDIMRDSGQTWVSENGDQKGKMLRKLIASPDSIPTRMEFAKAFWVDLVPALGPDLAEARRMLIDTLKLNPDEGQRLQIYQIIKQHSNVLGDTAAVVEFSERICREFAGNADVCDQTLMSLAQFFAAKGESRKAIETYDRMLKLRLGGKMAGTVHLGLADVSMALKDEASMVRHLEEVARVPAPGQERNIFVNGPRQGAIGRLGKHYQDKKNFTRALGYFRAWEPQSFCGNGQAELSYARDLHIAQCLHALGDSDQALKKNLLPHLTNDPASFRHSDTEIPALTVAIYESRKDLDGFVTLIRPHAAPVKNNGSAQIALGLAEIRIERRDGKIDALIARLHHSGSFVPNICNPFDNWKAPAAALALSELSGKEFPQLRARYEELVPPKGDASTRAWVLYAIALSECPEAGAYLDSVLKQAKQDRSIGTIGAALIRYDECLHIEKTRSETERKIEGKKQ